MKGHLLAFVLAILAGFGLWQMRNSIADQADTNANFVALYRTAQAARAKADLYALKKSSLLESTDAEAAAQGDSGQEVAVAVESTSEEAATEAAVESTATATGTAQDRAAFQYPPYVAIILIPLTYIASHQTAALTLYCINIAFVLIAAAFAIYALSGSFSTGRVGTYLVAMVASAPFVYYFLPTQSLTLFAMVIVLAGLAIYRQRQDAIAGFVTALAVFSPLGIVFGLYYLLKRSWTGVIGYIVGLAVFFVGLPMIVYHPDGATKQMQDYSAAVVTPYVNDIANTALLGATDNQSVWAILMQRKDDISSLGEEAAKYGESYNVSMPQITSRWTEVAFILVGVILLFASLLGVTRKLRDRSGLIVGLEGALLIVTVLLLEPFTYLPDMVLVTPALFAAAYVVMNTDLKRLAHHINYVGLVLATAFFYLTFDPRFRLAGCAFAGVFILWVAVLAGINRFRPQIVTGRGAHAYAVESKSILDKPVTLAKVSPHKESIAKHLEEHRQAAGLRQSAKGTPSDKTPTVQAADTRATQVKEPSGLAKLFMHFKSKELPPVDLGAGEKKDRGGDKDAKPKEEPPKQEPPKKDSQKDRTIPLE